MLLTFVLLGTSHHSRRHWSKLRFLTSKLTSRRLVDPDCFCEHGSMLTCCIPTKGSCFHRKLKAIDGTMMLSTNDYGVNVCMRKADQCNVPYPAVRLLLIELVFLCGTLCVSYLSPCLCAFRRQRSRAPYVTCVRMGRIVKRILVFCIFIVDNCLSNVFFISSFWYFC